MRQWDALSAPWVHDGSQTQPSGWLRARSERNLPFTVEATVVFPGGKGNQREISTSLLCTLPWVGSDRWWPWQLFHPQPHWFSLQQALHRRAAEENLWSRGGRFDRGQLNEEDYGTVKRHLEVWKTVMIYHYWMRASKYKSTVGLQIDVSASNLKLSSGSADISSYTQHGLKFNGTLAPNVQGKCLG